MKFSGMHSMPLQTYTKADGSTIDYHLAEAYGIYNTEPSAKGALTREVRHAKSYGKWVREFSLSEKPSEIDAFVEVSDTSWQSI
jgi:hypothetical protein